MSTKTLREISYPVLTMAERDRRFALAKRFMEERDLDVLVMTGSGTRIFRHWCTNQFYLSNEPDGTNAIVVFPRESAPVLLMIRTQWQFVNGDVRDGAEPWIEDIRLQEPPISIASVLRERNLQSGRAGVITAAGETPYGSLADPAWQAVQAELPDLRCEDVASSFTIETLPKSPEELELARAAGRAAENAGAAIVEAAGTGVSEVELHAVAAEHLARGGVDWSILLMAVGKQTLGWGPPRWMTPLRPPRTLEPDDMVMVEFFPVYGGIDTQFQMSLHVGEPSERLQKLAAVNRASYEAGVAALKPGVRFDSVWQAMQAPIFEAGCWDWDPLIHSLPMQLLGPMHVRLARRSDVHETERDLPPWPPGFDAANPSSPGSEVRLKEGMLFANEPGAADGDDRMLFGGLMAVTADGSEEMTTFGGDLHVVE